jgi:hypothetical protein
MLFAGEFPEDHGGGLRPGGDCRAGEGIPTGFGEVKAADSPFELKGIDALGGVEFLPFCLKVEFHLPVVERLAGYGWTRLQELFDRVRLGLLLAGEETIARFLWCLSPNRHQVGESSEGGDNEEGGGKSRGHCGDVR